MLNQETHPGKTDLPYPTASTSEAGVVVPALPAGDSVISCRELAPLFALALGLALPIRGKAQQAPDLTKVDHSTIVTTYNYNLGPTGMRGWIYNYSTGTGSGLSMPVLGCNMVDGTTTSFQPWQILVVAVGTKTASAGIMASNDVILGVSTGAGNLPVPYFTNDARKSIGWAVGAAEAGDGVMNLKRWRAGVTVDVAITLPLSNTAYSTTAPYGCPKSTVILSNALSIVGSYSFNKGTPANQILGLSLLASGNTNYLSKLQTYARSISSPPSVASVLANDTGLVNWDWAYNCLFLSEYYLNTGDAAVLPVLKAYTTNLVQGQSRYGTYGHSVALLNTDGSYNGTVRPYGPVNMVGLAANLALVLGRKSILASGGGVDPAIDTAIARAANFFSFYVQKGNLPYGEHEPWPYHGSNGKDSLAALLFAAMGDQPLATEYWTRLSLAGYNGHEEGHSTQAFSYLYGALAANVGGTNAVASYLAQLRWKLDLLRRSDGSFAYDGYADRNFGGNASYDYWNNLTDGKTGIPGTLIYVLTFAIPKQQLYITGKNANATNWLSADKVTNAIWAATFDMVCTNYSTNQLMSALGEYDPLVRAYAAVQMASLTDAAPLFPALTNLAIGSTNAWLREAACNALGELGNTGALPVLAQALKDPDVWVRARAARAIRGFTPAMASAQLSNMLMAFISNASNPSVIDWTDPVQIANGYLSFALFGDAVYGGNTVSIYTRSAAKSLLYPAVKTGLKQPDSNPRDGVAVFTQSLPLSDVKELVLDIIAACTNNSQADTMWSPTVRGDAIQTLMNNKVAEAMPLSLSMLKPITGWSWGTYQFAVPAIDGLANYGDSARWTLSTLTNAYNTLANMGNLALINAALDNAIPAIRNAVATPAGITNLLPVASPQVVVATTGTKPLTLTGFSCRTNVLTFTNVSPPAHGTLTGTAPNLLYTPVTNFSGVDRFTFQVADYLATSAPGTVNIIVGAAGTGLTGAYFNSPNLTNFNFARIDPEVNFDWGSSAPTNTMSPSGFSVQWSGTLLAPETGSYRFSTLNGGNVNLLVNGVHVLSDVNPRRQWDDGTSIALTAGQTYPVQMNFSSYTGDSVVKLKWTGPSFAGSNGVLISQQWLFCSNSGVFVINQAASIATITETAATLNAQLTSGGTNANVYVYWNTVNAGTNAALWTNSASVGTWDNVVSAGISYPVTGLAPGTTYFFTFMATNSAGIQWATNVLSFTTLSGGTPAVGNSGGAMNLTVGVSELRGTLTNGPAHVRLYWGSSDGGVSSTSWANVNVLPNASSGAFASNVSNLLYGVTYYYRSFASNQIGSSWALTTTNFTPMRPASSLVNSTASNITTNSAKLNATLSCPGAVYGVVAYWGTVNGGTNAAQWANSALLGTWTNVSSANISCMAGGLSMNTIYYFTFRGTNVADSLWDTNVQCFTTAEVPGSVVLLSADFTNSVIYGNTASNITYILNGVANPGPLRATNVPGSGVTGVALFNGATVGSQSYDTNYFAPNNGTSGNSAWWMTDVPLIVGVYPISPTNVVVVEQSFDSTGAVKTSPNGTAHYFTVYLYAPSGNVLGSQRFAATNSSTWTAWTNSFNFLTGINLTASKAYKLRFIVSGPTTNLAAVAGNYVALKHFIVNGSVSVPAPVVDNASGATTLTAGMAQLRGNLSNGPADLRLCWGTTDGGTNKASWANISLLSGIPSGPFSSNVSNLLYGTTYYYRSFASNQWGASWARATTNFTTLPPDNSISNLPATEITTSAATLNASLVSVGNQATIYVYWNTVNGGTNAVLWTNSGLVGVWSNAAASISYPVAGLASNTTYCFTFMAANAGGNQWATNVLSFKTISPPPPLPVLPGSAITLTGGVPSFTFSTIPGYQYRLASKATLTDALWVPVIAPPTFPAPAGWSATSTGSLMFLRDTNTAGQSQRFYRLEAAVPP